LEFKNISETIFQMNPSAKKEYISKLKFALVNKYPFFRKFSKQPLLLKKYPELDFLNSRLYDSTYTTILPTLLRNYDRYSMMNGIEIRMPFLDYRIQQFAFSIPYDSKIRNGFSKSIVRDALKGIVPEKILQRKGKIGFNSPIDSWVKRKEFKEWLDDELVSTDFNNSTTVDPAEVKKSVHTLIHNRPVDFVSGSALFEKIIPYIWEKGLKLYAK